MQSKKRRFGKKRIAALLLSVCLIIPSISGSADSIAETENRISQLQSQKKELDSKLASLKDDEDKALQYQETLVQKIKNVESQIDEAREQITTLDADIVILEAKLQKAKDEMGTTLDKFYDSVEALYKTGTGFNLGTLEILLNAESLYDFSVKNETVKSVNEYNQQQMDMIREYQENTRAEREELEEKKSQVAELKMDLEKNQIELESLYEENSEAIQTIVSLQLETSSEMTQVESESQEMQDRLEDLIAQEKARQEAERKAAEEAAAAAAQNNSNSGGGSSGGGSSYSGGSSSPSKGSGNSSNSGGGSSSSPEVISDSGGTSFAWPIPGVYTITQHYGNNGHNGIDIAGAYGTPIVAAESGTVIEANGSDSWGQSWGYYVLIYHNGTYTTRYAHLSSLAVSSGQSVSRGQVIGYEGSTGNSTGPHLHFEVYKNGKRTNPYPYIS